MRLALLAAALLLGTPARAWEAKASGVEKRLAAHPTPASARQRSKPAWARRIKAPEDQVRWTEAYRGKTYLFGVGLARGIDNAGLRVTAAQDRARAGLLEPGEKSGELEGSQILDWYLNRSGDMYALAVLIR
jgi:hypothetical protein